MARLQHRREDPQRPFTICTDNGFGLVNASLEDLRACY
jgi:hypothetical protein